VVVPLTRAAEGNAAPAALASGNTTGAIAALLTEPVAASGAGLAASRLTVVGARPRETKNAVNVKPAKVAMMPRSHVPER
jgi:hypothetical protein